MTAWLGWLALVASAHATDRALLIETSVQPEGSTWHGADLTDALPMMTQALQARGIDPIDTLSGEAATRKGILDALEHLHASTEPGDLVVVYYTGHGAQLPDDNRDEPDGLDEVLVPYGAADTLSGTESDEDSGFVRDDELGRAVDALSRRVGAAGHVLVMVDACHSGSATRGAEEGALIGRTLGGEATGDETGSGWSERPPDNLVVLSAARHDQLAAWGPAAAGTLTRLAAPLLAEAGEALSYRALLRQLQEEMVRVGESQEPQGEGAIDTTVLSGHGAQQPFFEVTGADGSEVNVRGGTLGGLTRGARIALYPPGTRSADGSPLGTGVVVETGPASSRVRLDGPAPEGPLWALVTEPGDPALLRWSIDPSAAAIEPLVHEKLDGVTGAVASADGPWRIAVIGKGKQKRVAAVHRDGLTLEGPEVRGAEAADWSGLQDGLGRAAIGTALREASLGDPEYALELRLRTPMVTRGVDSCRIDGVEPPAFEGTTAAHAVDQPVVVEVLYEGEATAYLTVVGFTPEGELATLFPPPGASDAASEVTAGASFLIGSPDCLLFDTAGTYVFKAWATPAPFDVTWLHALQPVAERGSALPEVGALRGHTASVVVRVD